MIHMYIYTIFNKILTILHELGGFRINVLYLSDIGVNTSDILTAYIAAIRALRILDPVGVILELVCDPVRKYLMFKKN